MIEQTLSPVLFSLGAIEIRYYGLVYALSFLFLWWFFNKKRKELDMTKEQVESLIFYVFLGMLSGARLLHFIFDNPSALINDPFVFFKLWQGGMSFFGALIGSTLAAYLYINKIRKSFPKVADTFVIPVALALFFGRLANYLNSELVGVPAPDTPWCVVFPLVDDVCRHPYQIYAAIAMLTLFFSLLWLKNRKLKDLDLFLWFVLIYSVLRIITDFWRLDTVYFGLTSWQYVSVIFMGVSAYFLYKNDKRHT